MSSLEITWAVGIKIGPGIAWLARWFEWAHAPRVPASTAPADALPAPRSANGLRTGNGATVRLRDLCDFVGSCNQNWAWNCVAGVLVRMSAGSPSASIASACRRASCAALRQRPAGRRSQQTGRRRSRRICATTKKRLRVSATGPRSTPPGHARTCGVRQPLRLLPLLCPRERRPARIQELLDPIVGVFP